MITVIELINQSISVDYWYRLNGHTGLHCRTMILAGFSLFLV